MFENMGRTKVPFFVDVAMTSWLSAPIRPASSPRRCLGHRFPFFTHADHGHRIQPSEQRAISELNVVRNSLYADVTEPILGQ